MKDKKDFELIKEFLDGSDAAINELIKRYQSRIYWHARRMLGNHLDADEVTQEVLIVLFEKLKTFNFNSSLYTWIYKITSTRTLNFIRRKQIKRFFSPEEVSESELANDHDIIKSIDDRERIKRIEKLLMDLPPKQREVFILRNFEELSYNEIAEITGKSVGALKANYFHALQKITEKMNDE